MTGYNTVQTNTIDLSLGIRLIVVNLADGICNCHPNINLDTMLKLPVDSLLRAPTVRNCRSHRQVKPYVDDAGLRQVGRRYSRGSQLRNQGLKLAFG